jgi:hypothetical protein
MLTQGKELSALDFADIIGGPLVAVINAQAKAAIATTNFIQTFAFTKDHPPKLQTVQFDFSQVLGSALSSANLATNVTSIQVPLLTIIPIPYIRVDNVSINLNVTLHSTSSTSFSNDFALSASAGGSFFTNWSVSVTDKNTYQFGSTVDDTYSLQVAVHAVQDTMPAGMAQVLGIFSNVITSQAALIQTLVTAEVAALTKAAQQSLAGPNPPA